MIYASVNKITLLGLICTIFTINVLSAQTIPSRPHNGVIMPKQTDAKKDLYAGLKLTKEQQKQIGELGRERRKMLQTLQEDKTRSAQEKRAKAAEINRQLDARRRDILTPEQNRLLQQNWKKTRSGKDKENSSRVIKNNPRKITVEDRKEGSRNSFKKTSNR